MDHTIGILLFDDVEELDFVGPWEVFTMARMAKPQLKVITIAAGGKTVTCAKGLRVIADHDLSDAPNIDVLLVPGGMGTRREVGNQPLLDWIARTAEGCQWVSSVCTGALLLTEAGPAAGKRVTTHWGFIEALRKRGKAREVVTGARFVRDGNVVSAAGVSAGIDMALWLIGQCYDPAFARQVQHHMEYYPAPPYTADI